MLLERGAKSGCVDLWVHGVELGEVVFDSLVMLALLLVGEAHIVVDGTGITLHFGGSVELDEGGIVVAVQVKGDAKTSIHEERERIKDEGPPHVTDGF